MKLSETELFRGIPEKQCVKIEKCLNVHIIDYKKGETVCVYGEGTTRIGIVLTGRAAIIRTDVDGYETLLENLPESAVFSELLSYAKTAGDSILVRSMEKSQIAYLDYDKIRENCAAKCTESCSGKEKLSTNFTDMLINRAGMMSQRIEILCCHTIREKILCYCRLRLKGSGFGTVRMTMTMTELAKYLNTDRSAMMRELRNMRLAGLIEVNRHGIKLVSDISAHGNDIQKSDTADTNRKINTEKKKRI